MIGSHLPPAMASHRASHITPRLGPNLQPAAIPKLLVTRGNRARRVFHRSRLRINLIFYSLIFAPHDLSFLFLRFREVWRVLVKLFHWFWLKFCQKGLQGFLLTELQFILKIRVNMKLAIMVYTFLTLSSANTWKWRIRSERLNFLNSYS